MDVYSTAGVPAGRRTSYWNEVYTSHFAQVSFDPVSRENFEAELRTGSMGPLGLARVSYYAAEVERTRSHIDRTHQRLFSFVLHLRGRGVFTHYGHRTVLDAGDLTLSDNAEPHHLSLQGPADVIILRSPPEVLEPYLPSPERLCGLRLPAQEGFTSTAAAMMRSLADQIERGLSPRFSQMLVRSVLEVMATSYAMVFDKSVADCSGIGARRVQARRYIEAHLTESDLTATAIARALDVSPRYVRMVFAAERETVSEYILRRRLEECARQLASSLWLGRTITEIAYACGFNSVAHFTRAFRQKYAMTPRQYRETHLPNEARLS
jgi:AraC family transcriptional regulator, positive regulator of tynA and feaB